MPERFPSRQATLIRLLALLQVFLLLASLFAPIPALAADPSADPSATPAASDPAPSQDPTASPDPSVAPDPSPSADPAPVASDAPSASPDPSPAASDAPSADPVPGDPSPAPSADPTAAPVVDPTPAPATTRYIVAFDPGTTAATRATVLGVDGATLVDSIAPLGLYVVDTIDGSGAYTSIANDPAVLRVDLDRERAAEALPDDPGAAGQWALETIGWTSVFDTVSPSGTATVALLDTGVDASVADLAGALVGGTSVLDGSAGTTDPNGHGTAMASIIAAATGNGTGIAGVGYAGVRVMPVTVLGADGTGQDSDVIAGIVWAVQHGADVINMSFSNPGYSASLQAAIDWAWSNGAVIVAATGNDGSSAVTFPAGDRGVVGVSATDRSDAIASWSNRGTDVFLAAPGEGVSALARDGGIVSIDGTSASSAIVAAAAALLRANDPGASNGVIVGRLARTADAVGTASETGNGRLNLARALGDTGTDAVKPAGAAPVGDGGPFVGPYTAAACTVSALSVGAQSGTLVYGTSSSVTFAITLTKTNGNCSGTFTVTGLPASVTSSLTPATFSGSGTSKTSTLTITTTTSTPAGAISFSVSGGGSDTGGSVSGSGTLSVNKATLNVNAVAATKVYGNADPAFTWTYSGFVSPDNAGNTTITGSASCTRTGDNNVGGTKTITCAPGTLSAANYSFATGTTAALTISKRQLAVNAVATGKTYGQTDPALTSTLSGFTGTDNATNSSITGTASCSRTAGETVALSPYTITCSAGTLSAPNYSFASGSTALFSIGKATLSVNASPASKTYGDADPTFAWTYSGFVSPDSAATSGITGSASCTRTGDEHVAGTKTITCAPGTLSAPNYSFATGASAAFTIGQRPVGVTADPQAKVYGDADPALTYQVTSGSVVPGDVFTGALARDPGEIVASYAITQGTLDLGPDYALSFTGALLSITKAPSTVTVTCPSAPQIYTGGELMPCTASATGVNISPIDVSGSIVYSNNINVGTASAFAEWSGDDNHFGDTGSATFEIAKAPSFTVVSCPSSVIYDATAQTPCSVSVTGAGGLSLSPTATHTDNTNAGTATASYSYLGDANHEGSSDSKTFTISKAPSVVSVTCTAPNTFTGAAIEPCTAEATGVGISTPVVLTVSYTDNVHAGTAHASATWAGDANHDGNTGNQTFTIDKAPSTVTVTCPMSVQYTAGAQEPCTAEATGVAMTSVNLTGDIVYADNIVVGTASASATWLGDADHEGDSGFATFEITKAPLTITAHDQTKTYGTAFTFAGTEFDAATILGSDSVDSVTLTSAGSAATATVNGGPYAIVASDAVGTGLENYEITYVDGELSVTQAAAACTITPYSGTYDGDAHEATGSCVGVFGEPLDGLDLSATARRNAGSYSNLPWSLRDPDGNYADTDGTTTASIAQAALDLYATPDTRPYDRTTTSSATPTTGPLQGTDSVTGLVQAFDDAGAGARTLTITAYTVDDGAGGANYVVTLHPAAGTIEQAPASVSFTVVPKTYDATTDATIATCDVSGTIAPDDVTCDASGATASFADAHAGTGKPVTGSGFGLLGADAANYAITTVDAASGDIAKAQPVCTVTGYDVTYDGADHTATGDCAGVEGESLAGLDLSGTTHRDAGSYTDGWTFTDVTGDYEDDAGSVSSTIDQAPLTITPDDDSKVYGTAWTPSGTGFTTSALATGDSVASVTLASTGAPAAAPVVVGGYPITASGATGTGLANYAITYGTGTLTVTKATATIVATGWSGTYDANPHTISVTATGVLGEDLSAGITLGASIRNVPGGTVSWSFSDPTGNHEDASGSAAVVIGTAPLVLNAVPDTKVADGNTSSAGTPTVATLLGTDSITGLAQAFDSSAAGARILSVQPGYTIDDGNGGANYAVSTSVAAGTINPGPADHLVILQQPTGGVTNAPLSPSIIVGVRDAYDNVVTGAGRAITLSLYDPFPEAAWIMGTTTVATAADGTATFTDIAIDTPGTFVLEATSAGVTSDFSNPVSINAGTLFADIATGDADWQNEVDGVDVLFAKTGTGSTTKYTLKATNPGTFKYRLSLTNETGSDIHVRGSALPEIIRDGVSLKNRNGASAAVILTVPSMPALLGTDSPLTAAQAAQPAFMLVGSRPVHVNPDDRSDDMPVTVSWVAELPSGVTSCEQVTTWNTSPLADGAVVRCLKVEGLAIPRHHQARISVAYEFRWKNTAGWGSATSDASTAFRAGFSFVSVTQIALDAFPTDLDTHAHDHWGRLPSALRTKLLSDFAALWGRTYKGYSALGLAFAGEKVTALGGFLFDTGAQGLRDVTVRVFSAKPAGNACQAGLAYGTNGYVADATTATDGFWFIWQKNLDNTALVTGTNTLPSGSRYFLALCDMTGDRHALPFDQLYWPTRTMDHTLGSKEFDEEDFFVSGPTRLEFQQQPLTGRKGQTLGTVKVALLDGFGNVLTMDSSSKVTLSATTSTGTSTALSSTSTQPLVDRVLTNGTATWTGLKLSAAGTYKLLASSSITGVTGAVSLAISISN